MKKKSSEEEADGVIVKPIEETCEHLKMTCSRLHDRVLKPTRPKERIRTNTSNTNGRRGHGFIRLGKKDLMSNPTRFGDYRGGRDATPNSPSL
jgi:hypothetical protein